MRRAGAYGEIGAQAHLASATESERGPEPGAPAVQPRGATAAPSLLPSSVDTSARTHTCLGRQQLAELMSPGFLAEKLGHKLDRQLCLPVAGVLFGSISGPNPSLR